MGRTRTCVGRHCVFRVLQQPVHLCTSTHGGHTRKLALVESTMLREISKTSVRVLHSASTAASTGSLPPRRAQEEHFLVKSVLELNIICLPIQFNNMLSFTECLVHRNLQNSSTIQFKPHISPVWDTATLLEVKKMASSPHVYREKSGKVWEISTSHLEPWQGS